MTRWTFGDSKTDFPVVVLVVASAMAMAIVALVDAQQMPGDGCDWSGSGLEHADDGHGVQPVYFRCLQGTVKWLYPRGALRVVLRRGSSGKDFRGCIKATPSFEGARVYLEGHKKLNLLYAPADGRHPSLPRCFTSKHGQAALYVEAEPSQDFVKKMVAEFSYNLQPVSEASYTDPLEECRPCTEDELLRMYCISDFVVTGSLSVVHHNEELDRSELVVRAHRVVRDLTSQLLQYDSSNPSSAIFKEEDEVSGTSGIFARLHVPLKCGVRQGAGEFLFVGGMVLGDPVLRCAPRLVDWEKVMQAAQLDGRAQCELE